MISVYADESCKDNHKYLILGGICAEFEKIDEITSILSDVRRAHNTYGEVKWGKVSKRKYKFYEDYVRKIFYIFIFCR